MPERLSGVLSLFEKGKPHSRYRMMEHVLLGLRLIRVEIMGLSI